MPREFHCGSVRIDETFIKIRGQWRLLYQAIDKHGTLRPRSRFNRRRLSRDLRYTCCERRLPMSDIPDWHIIGDWFDNCSCAVACPCTFAQAPDNGFCESVLFWHVREGHYGDVKLDNLSFVRVGRWEGDLWARNASGVAGLYIDEHADDRQMEALPAIIGGRAGGFPGWVNECFAGGRQSRGIERAKITYQIAPAPCPLGGAILRQGQGRG